MRAVVKGEIIDILPYTQGFLYLEAQELEDGNTKASFFAFDQESDTIFPVKKGDYLRIKYGPQYQRITQQLEDFVFCRSIRMMNKTQVVLYEDGKLLQFYANGEQLRSEMLQYQGSPACSPCEGDNSLWCVVPEQNAVIHYSLAERRVLLRIGGGSSTAFANPVSVTRVVDKLYICSKNAFKIRTLSLDNYNVRDYVSFQEPVQRYFRIADKEYVLLESGVYRL